MNSQTRFLVGFLMLAFGLYLFLSAVRVGNIFSSYYGIFSVGRFRVTSGMVLIPFVIGIGMVFFDSKNVWGWLLMLGSMVMLFFGVIMNLQIYLRTMSAIELLFMVILVAGGTGLMLGGMRREG